MFDHQEQAKHQYEREFEDKYLCAQLGWSTFADHTSMSESLPDCSDSTSTDAGNRRRSNRKRKPPGRLTYKCKGDALGKKRVRSCDLKTETFTALDLRNSSKVYVCVSPFQCFKCNSISIFLWLISLYLPLSLNLYVVTSCHHLCILYVSSSQPYLRLRRDHH